MFSRWFLCVRYVVFSLFVLYIYIHTYFRKEDTFIEVHVSDIQKSYMKANWKAQKLEKALEVDDQRAAIARISSQMMSMERAVS